MALAHDGAKLPAVGYNTCARVYSDVEGKSRIDLPAGCPSIDLIWLAGLPGELLLFSLRPY